MRRAKRLLELDLRSECVRGRPNEEQIEHRGDDQEIGQRIHRHMVNTALGQPILDRQCTHDLRQKDDRQNRQEGADWRHRHPSKEALDSRPPSSTRPIAPGLLPAWRKCFRHRLQIRRAENRVHPSRSTRRLQKTSVHRVIHITEGRLTIVNDAKRIGQRRSALPDANPTEGPISRPTDSRHNGRNEAADVCGWPHGATRIARAIPNR